MMQAWEVLGDQNVYENALLRVHLERIRTPAGDETDWTLVEIADGAAVLPLGEDGSVWMIEQYRHTAGRALWEFPAGRVEVGEDPLDAARRELREEAGLLAAEIESLGAIWPLDGMVRHRIHLFTARGLERVEHEREKFEAINAHSLDAERFGEMIRNGEIEDGVALALALRHHARFKTSWFGTTEKGA